MRWSSANPRSRCEVASSGLAAMAASSVAMRAAVGDVGAVGPGDRPPSSDGRALGATGEGAMVGDATATLVEAALGVGDVPAGEQATTASKKATAKSRPRVRTTMSTDTGRDTARMNEPLDDASRVQDSQRVERGLDRAHHADGVGTLLDLEPLTPRR